MQMPAPRQNQLPELAIAWRQARLRLRFMRATDTLENLASQNHPAFLFAVNFLRWLTTKK